MPLYEYGCLECGAQFEKLVRKDNLDNVLCPTCESSQVERLLSLFSTSQGAPNSNESPAATSPGLSMHKPHCGYDWT